MLSVYAYSVLGKQQASMPVVRVAVITCCVDRCVPHCSSVLRRARVGLASCSTKPPRRRRVEEGSSRGGLGVGDGAGKSRRGRRPRAGSVEEAGGTDLVGHLQRHMKPNTRPTNTAGRLMVLWNNTQFRKKLMGQAYATTLRFWEPTSFSCKYGLLLHKIDQFCYRIWIEFFFLVRWQSGQFKLLELTSVVNMTFFYTDH